MIKLKELFEPNNIELQKVYSNPYHTAFKSLNEEVERKLYIMIGLPGSGKSTFIKTLNNPTICSADHYFEKSGEYKFDINKLGSAHQECKNKCLDSMLMSKPLIVIDNTNLNDKERKPYEDMAEKYGYEIVYILFEPNKKNIETLAKRNLHGVTAAKLEVMLDRYRPPSGEKGKIIFK
jgi:predicted kinase